MASVLSLSGGLLRVLIPLAIAVWLCAPARAQAPGQGLLERLERQSSVAEGYTSEREVTERLSQLPLHPVEGLWKFPSEGSVMAIERMSENPATVYRMVVIRAADRRLRPGTVMGYLTATAKRDTYDARIYTSRSLGGTALYAPKTYTLTLTDSDTRISLRRYGTKMVFNWWRLLPYMYRYVFSRRDREPGDIEGCVRVYPDPDIPLTPRYL